LVHLVLPSFPTRRSSDLDVDVAQFLELVIHAGELALDVLWRVGNFFLDPGDIKVDAAMRAAPAGADFAEDAAGNVIARQKLRGRSEEHTSELQSPYDLVC